jgi:small-conductance mechanosensitive channel
MQIDQQLEAAITPFFKGVTFDQEIFSRFIMTFTICGLLWAVRIVLTRLVRRKTEILSSDQRRWTRMVKNLIWIFVVMALIMIWAPQLRTAALSLTAFAMAVVVATKEVILCFTGAFMRVSTAPFRMGDWITIDNITGEVLDINPFSVRIQELEVDYNTFAFTGRIIQVPNSRYFVSPIINLSHMKHYRVHIFNMGFQEDRIAGAELASKMREIALKHTIPYKDEALQARTRISRNSTIPLPDPAAQVTYVSKDFNNHTLTVRAFLPTRSALNIASSIQEDFQTWLRARREECDNIERIIHIDEERKIQRAKTEADIAVRRELDDTAQSATD